MPSPVCRHCRAAAVNRPRGLCWACYHAPGVRERYPSVSRYARRGVGNLTGPRPLPAPTAARPGTPDKVAVMAGRAALGHALWHPADAGPLAAAQGVRDFADRPATSRAVVRG